MSENLKTTKYNDGITIPLVKDKIAWSNLTTPAYCWKDNDEFTNKSIYGALYNWFAVSTDKLCPSGWHIPSKGEWTTLLTYLGGRSVAGGKLKETRTPHLRGPNKGATNESGFTALPGGFRTNKGDFTSIGLWGRWWSSAETEKSIALCWQMFQDKSFVEIQAREKRGGFSVRCVKN